MKKKIVQNSIALAFASTALVPLASNAGEVKFIEPPMVSIPAGDFMMGSERGRENEKPVHNVSVPAFQMGKYEVTIAEFRKFIEATDYKMSNQCVHRIGERWFGSGEKDGSWDNNIYASNEHYPVVCISRIDAINYAKWLSDETGKNYRLPTEAEWEYTVRAGTSTRYFFGDEVDSSKACEFANLSDLHANNLTEKMYNAVYNDNYTIQPCSDNEVIISTVGLYKPNPFGVYDLLGNVVERLADCYQDSYQGAPVDGSAVVKKECKRYVARGGSWHWEAFRSSARMPMSDDFLAALEGFRIVLDTGGKALPSQVGNKKFVKRLALSQAKAKAQHAKNPAYPGRPDGLQIVKATDKKVTLNWNKNNESFISGYQVFRQNPLTNEKKLISTGLKESNFIDTSPLAHNARYSVVALNDTAESLSSEIIDSGVAIIHNLPTKIEGEAFSMATGASVRNSGMEPDEDKIIASLGKGKASYQLQVSQLGEYRINARVFHSGPAQKFELWLNDKKLNSPSLEGERGWKSVDDITIELSPGTYTLSIQGEQPLFAVNWLDVKKI